ncbi:MAG: response regulator transcription factor [Ruminococcus sp.]|nr:response regulator transcription factor [Ruminococcus sp.]
MKILYAEDEKQLSAAVTEILKMEGFTVTPVYNGSEAVEAMKTDFFDAVILDIMMPVMDGVETLRYMRNNGIHTPVLMLTAKSTVDDRIAGLSEGADDYLTKPFAMKELVARLRSLLRRSGDYRHSVIKYANIELNTDNCELKPDKGSLRLNNTEAELLSFLVRNINTGFTPEKINSMVWNGKGSSEKAELYLFYLKNKLRQIRADVNILTDGGEYSLGDEKA